MKRIKKINEISLKVKEMSQDKNSSGPKDGVDHNLVNDIYDYILEYGTKSNEKGNLTINNNYIYPKNYRILINLTLFKNDFDLLKRMLKLSVCERSELFRIAIEKVIRHNLNLKVPVDLEGIDFLLKNDVTKTI